MSIKYPRKHVVKFAAFTLRDGPDIKLAKYPALVLVWILLYTLMAGHQISGLPMVLS